MLRARAVSKTGFLRNNSHATKAVRHCVHPFSGAPVAAAPTDACPRRCRSLYLGQEKRLPPSGCFCQDDY